MTKIKMNVGGGSYNSGNVEINSNTVIDSGGNISTQNLNISNSTVSGSVVAAERIENSFNSLQESKADNEVKDLLAKLLSEINVLNTKVPIAQVQSIENMAKRAYTLITEIQSENPDKEWYQLSFKGIKEAALAIGDTAKPVLDIAEKLSPLLLD